MYAPRSGAGLGYLPAANGAGGDGPGVELTLEYPSEPVQAPNGHTPGDIRWGGLPLWILATVGAAWALSRWGA